MKYAISGKGGVGKTLLAALLAKEFHYNGFNVIAIDADPDTNLASALGYLSYNDIIPISEMKELITDRTGVAPGKPGSLFKLNPKVDDIPEKYSHNIDGMRLMVMGKLKRGGSGCYCAENTLLQALMAHLLVGSNDVVILDMAAGIEHLSRATAKYVDRFIVVVEPGQKSIETAFRIKKMSAEIGITNLSVVANKIRNDKDVDFIKNKMPEFEILGYIHYDPAVIDAETNDKNPLEASEVILNDVRFIYKHLISTGNDINKY